MILPDLLGNSSLYREVRVWLGLSAAAFLLLLSAAGYSLTAGKAMKSARAESSILGEQRERLLSNLEEVRLIKERESELLIIKSKMARQSSANEIMGSLQGLAEACGIRIVEHRAFNNGGDGKQNMLRTQMAVEGSYAGIRRYLAEIPMHVSAFTAIGSLRIKPGMSERMLSVELEMFSYNGGK
jgi:hypothetical protein